MCISSTGHTHSLPQTTPQTFQIQNRKTNGKYSSKTVNKIFPLFVVSLQIWRISFLKNVNYGSQNHCLFGLPFTISFNGYASKILIQRS